MPHRPDPGQANTECNRGKFELQRVSPPWFETEISDEMLRCGGVGTSGLGSLPGLHHAVLRTGEQGSNPGVHIHLEVFFYTLLASDTLSCRSLGIPVQH